MSILVVGSVAYDDLETPAGKRKNILGGAASHFSASASFFAPVDLIGVVGSDFDFSQISFLQERGVNLSGLETISNGKTFHWTGHYLNDLNHAETIDTQLGVFATFNPQLASRQRELPFVFLANIHPALQLSVLNQVKGPKLVAVDTMNLWINNEREALGKVIARADILFVNEGEAKLLTGEKNMVRAANALRAFGPKTVVIKRGEHGSILFTRDDMFTAPGMPLAEVTDPTGAGDSFAGGFMGYVARTGKTDTATLKRAVICGSVMASYQVEDFGLDRLRRLTKVEIDERFRDFLKLTQFDTHPVFSR